MSDRLPLGVVWNHKELIKPSAFFSTPEGIFLHTFLNPSMIPHNLQKVLSPFAGTTNPGGTRKPDNPLKGIQNPIPQNPDNPHKGIRYLVQNKTRIQWPRGLNVAT